ncbi:hypothetical protein SERLADRAFT_436853 [Serpula lacrymans var. lacrymans S7.9]|uniref:AMP-dependent synthetase/ligase domain-containing protein n=1 Tax=Serpula lacrymans var. lacrymans (strain S7.9) TaxID=578457 RepID=F8NQ72_SERL9|nr:uncharacterized protein SERLADRAFT_436853 [Serpula lacrymans var. lacrymans S7.9]EGO27024.1 hypothetical protein SERLADRAFT_436853 [Serpula lacrymans var. lacrymans S7.9]
MKFLHQGCQQYSACCDPSDRLGLEIGRADMRHTLAETLSIFQSALNLSPADRSRFVLHGVGAHQSLPYEYIHHAFSVQANKFPDAIAVEHFNEIMTFKTLDETSDILSRHLRSCGIHPGKRVCLLVQRSVAMIISILAILKSEAAYIPVDGGIVTDQTLRFISDDSNSCLVLCLSHFRNKVPSYMENIDLDSFLLRHSRSSLCPDPSFTDTSAGHHEAYVIYTSGTTGRPKGVSISHRNLTNWKLQMKSGARVSQLLNIAFDMCAWEVLGSLVDGCTLCIRGKAQSDWSHVLRTVDIVISTPMILQCYNPSDYPNTTIVNTIHSHVIGNPTPNNRIYILDDDMKSVPFGQIGMTWASGLGTSSGYVNRPELSSGRFVEDRFTLNRNLMFNTGDLCRWNAEGLLEHFGRIDDQVKVKGFRVELDGVASAMLSCTEVTRAVALLVNSALWGIICPKHVDIETVRKAISRSMPYYAVPSSFIALDALPMTRLVV